MDFMRSGTPPLSSLKDASVVHCHGRNIEKQPFCMAEKCLARWVWFGKLSLGIKKLLTLHSISHYWTDSLECFNNVLYFVFHLILVT
jgi:hypothetical protein